MKSLVIAPHPAFIKLKSFCWNTCFYNFGWISQVKSGWNLPDFRVKSGGFHEILVIAPTLHFIKLKSFCWNTCFYNLGGFHRWNLGEIHQISWWNPPDFRVKSTRFQGEIHQISGWNPPPCIHQTEEFCWNTCFYNFVWISQVISGWNPLDFTGQICRSQGEIWWISWNPWS